MLGAFEGRGDDGVHRAQRGCCSLGLTDALHGQCWIGLALPSTVGVPFGLAVAHEQDAGHCSTLRGGGRRSHYARPVARLRLFAQAREAAGLSADVIEGSTVDEVLAVARERYGDGFAAVLATAKVWVNGDPAEGTDPVGGDDEVAVLPPVSGGHG